MRSILIPPLQFLENPLLWLQAISTYRATISGGPNFAYQYCVDKIATVPRDLNLWSWEIAFNGAERIHLQTMQAFSEKFSVAGFKPQAFLPCYGLAEATLWVAGRKRGTGTRVLALDQIALQKQQVDLSVKSRVSNMVSCGAPSTSVKIVDPITFDLCSSHQVGEIWLNAPNVTAGYWQEAVKTEHSFNAKIKGDDSAYLRTGDLGFIHEGELYVTGRLKDMIIIRGVNYYPQDIEQTVCALYPELNGKVISFSVDNNISEKLIIMLCMPKVDKSTYATMMQEIADKVYQVHQIIPGKIIIVRKCDIQKTRSGKLQRLAAKQAFVGDKITVVFQQDFSDLICSSIFVDETNFNLSAKEGVALMLQTYIASTLGLPVKEISLMLPLVNYGLDSLAAVNMAAYLSKKLNRDLSALLLFEYPS
ncbi:MAG TPA: non-ribosomal peptide synthetase, partial [Gammaproteobacteria bacterium]|nr:non-ribosomal peptide synthetase [Gammaproteobacteria bacterium]